MQAINTEGEAKSSAMVNILPRMSAPEPMIIESNGYPPEFLQLFNDRKTSLGSTIQFEARVTGTQPLNVNALIRIKSNLSSYYFLGLLVI